MPRIYLRLPSHKCLDSSPCNLYWFSDGTQIDLNADQRCGTCKFFTHKAGKVGRCAAWVMDVPDSHGCATWAQRVVQGGDAPCPRCNGKGYIELENWHESEVHPCPKCAKP